MDIPEQGQGLTERSGEFEKRLMRLTDGRDEAESFTLDRHGFSFHRHETGMSDFLDEDQLLELYYPEVDALVKSATGAKKVHIFDHTIRIEDDGKRDSESVRAPVEIAHNDYTDKSGPQRVRDLFEPEEAEEWLQRRFAVINVWRSIGGPVVTTPLALSDASTMQPEDFIATDLVYKDRVGEISQIGYSDGQRWYYFSEMARDEALLIKCFDSATDGRARFTAHTAFTNPNAPDGAPPRESIEVRTLVAF
ncbi:MAG TPA: methyltransferase [Rhodospirillaceae bacterium]|nr:methyltransferase [Rhodospirillaceae bacterium]HAA91738.1 methyltransferase [Rhodospirillaceae bacterium]HAT35613.1 methyltransferase [Rhodospirillaceae bacterium]